MDAFREMNWSFLFFEFNFIPVVNLYEKKKNIYNVCTYTSVYEIMMKIWICHCGFEIVWHLYMVICNEFIAVDLGCLMYYV